MALMSPPILVAASTAYRCTFSGYLPSVNIQYRFYTDAEGTAELPTPGTGTRNLTVTNPRATAYENGFDNPTPSQSFSSLIVGGAVTGLPSETWREFFLGGGMQNIQVVAAPNVTPGAAATYRIIVDATGDSELV